MYISVVLSTLTILYNHRQYLILELFVLTERNPLIKSQSYGMGENICKQINQQGLNLQNIQIAQTIQ